MTEPFILGAIYVVVVLALAGVEWLTSDSTFPQSVLMGVWASMILAAGFGAVRACLTLLLG